MINDTLVCICVVSYQTYYHSFNLVVYIHQALNEDVKSFIIDTEAVAWDREKKQILPFQILSTRKRKVGST